jgi:hypothetical protein
MAAVTANTVLCRAPVADARGARSSSSSAARMPSSAPASIASAGVSFKGSRAALGAVSGRNAGARATRRGSALCVAALGEKTGGKVEEILEEPALESDVSDTITHLPFFHLLSSSHRPKDIDDTCRFWEIEERRRRPDERPRAPVFCWRRNPTRCNMIYSPKEFFHRARYASNATRRAQHTSRFFFRGPPPKKIRRTIS